MTVDNWVQLLLWTVLVVCVLAIVLRELGGVDDT